MELTQAKLRSLLDYNPETGIFINKVTRSHNASAGARAGTIRSSNGYRQINLCGRLHYEHRLVWLYVHGVWPIEQIDHINGERSDNRLCNLREVVQSENNANGLPRVGRVGLRGAYYVESRRKWVAQIVVNSQTIYLGYYDTCEKAHEAYLVAANNVYGKFAYHNRPEERN